LLGVSSLALIKKTTVNNMTFHAIYNSSLSFKPGKKVERFMDGRAEVIKNVDAISYNNSGKEGQINLIRENDELNNVVINLHALEELTPKKYIAPCFS
jgi:hypothetical protein